LGIGKSIAGLRIKRGWTQSKLAKSTGLSRGYISAIEEGRRNPSIKTLAIIAEKLGVSINKLNEEGGPP